MRIIGWAPRRALLLLAVFALGLAGMRPIFAQAPEALTVVPEVSPPNGTLGQVEFTVTLTLNGSKAQCTRTVSRPADIILVMDHSPSMYDPAGGSAQGTKLDVLKAAARTFLSKVDFKKDLVGLVEFDMAADVAQALTNDALALQTALDALEAGDGTSIDQGIVMAQREFESGRARGNASHIIVLLTDGRQSSPFSLTSAPLDAAREARQAGIRLITIGLGEDADQDQLREMASQPSDFYFAPQASDLQRIYATIAETVTETSGATNVVIEHTYDASALEIIPNSITPRGTLQGDKIVWTIAEVFDKPVTLSYRARPRAAGSYSIDRGDLVKYNRCGSEPKEIKLPASLPVVVYVRVRTSAPPTSTPTPVPTQTSPPTATWTPQPTPWPTETPTANERFQNSILSIFCNSSGWGWCLGPLLALFSLWWLWRLWAQLRKPAAERRPCRMIPWLLVPWGLLLLASLIPVLAGGLCSRESVYFWRIAAGQRDGQIWVTDKNGVRPAREFAAISKGRQCVGCHSVSSTSHRIAAVADGGSGPVVAYRLDGKPLDLPAIMGSYVAWSPDGNQLAVSTSEKDIAIIDVENKTVAHLAGASDPALAEEMPAWSPDGQRIAFVRGASAGTAWSLDGPCDIYTVPASGGAATPLAGASGDGFNYYPAYSPDGKWLAFTRHLSGATTYAAPEAEIFLVPAAGGERIRLAANDAPNGAPLQNVSNSWPTWSLTGEWLAFNSKRNDPAYDLFITQVDANGVSGPAIRLASAAQKDVFEHLPYWGEPPQEDPLLALLGLWPWLIPLALILLAWWLCDELRKRLYRATPLPPPPVEVRYRPGPLETVALNPLWQVAPTLIVGVGGTGRWVLTHLKKALRDGGGGATASGGALPEQVRFVLLDTSEREDTNLFRDAEGRVVGVEFAGVSLTPDEMLLMGQNLSAVLEQANRASDAALSDWLRYDHYRGLEAQQLNLAAGTHGRRPLARVGLVDRLRQGAQGARSPDAPSPPPPHDAAHLWATLCAGSQQVLDGNLVRVVVVGSLAGGMSGTLFDLAYLARRAAQGVVPPGGTVHLEGYFTTPGAFSGVPANQAQLEINAMAAGRELQRFQLSRGFPFPMPYVANPDAPLEKAQDYLLQACDWQLLDDVALFGGGGSPEYGGGKSSEPWATTLASMADVIAFRMDRAVNAGAAGDYRATVRGQVANKQANLGQAVVSAAGSYVLRLPLVDILDLVQARWANKLTHVFLNGSTVEGALSFDATQAQFALAPEDYAFKFVMTEHEAGEAPRGMRTVGYLSAGGEVLARDVFEFAEREGRPFSSYLSQALGLILNGSRVSTAALDHRAPRLGYALAFVQAVQARLLNAQQRALALQSSAPAAAKQRSWWQRFWVELGGGMASQAEWQPVVERIRSWSDVTGRTQSSLQGVCDLLAGTDPQGDKPAIRGLEAELQVRQAKAEQRRQQMNQVAVRRYLWSYPRDLDKDPADPDNQQDLAEAWYSQAEKSLPDYLSRFFWSVLPDGTVQLEVVTFDQGQKRIALDAGDPSSVQKLADELLHLAGYVTKDWAQKITLRDVLPTQMPRDEDPATRLIEVLWRVARPHLDPARDPNGQLDGEHVAAAGVPAQVQADRQLASLGQVLRELGTAASRVSSSLEPCSTSVLATTDRTALSLVREQNLMPIARLPEFQRAWRTYSLNAGRETDPLVEPALFSTVYAAERRALEYERRLEATAVLNQDFRTLQPLVVLALARPGLAELYALALAAGWVEVRASIPWLKLPRGGGDFELALPGRSLADSGLDPRVAGLLRVAAGRPEDMGLVAKLRAILSMPDEVTLDAWRRFVGGYRPGTQLPVKRVCAGPEHHEMRPEAKFCGKCGAPAAEGPAQPSEPWRLPFEGQPQAVQDLAALAALAAYHRLAPNEWDALVMRRARRAR